jgi:hypothetical protein
MNFRSIAGAMLLTLAIVVAADLTIGRLTRKTAPREVMVRIGCSPKAVEVLGIGNSLIAAGFDPISVEETLGTPSSRPSAVNAGLGASGVIEHLELTRLALRHHTIRYLVYGFFDQQMASDAPLRNSDLIGNRAILYYLEPDLTLQFAHFSIFNRAEFQLCRSAAILRERGSLWAKVEGLRRKMEGLGMPSQQSNQFGRKADFALLEASNSEDFRNKCRGVLDSGHMLSAPIQALFLEAKERGTSVIVVEMPMHPSHLQRFYEEPEWEEFRSKTRDAVEADGGLYLNASDWIFDPRLFSDDLHLSPNGAKQFSRMLAQHLMTSRN